MSTEIETTEVQPQRTLVLMSPQALFDTLALEVGRGIVPDVPATDHLLDLCNRRSMARPQHVDDQTLALLVQFFGPEPLALASDAAEDAADALPATQAISVIDEVIDLNVTNTDNSVLADIEPTETPTSEPITGILVEVDGPIRTSMKQALGKNRRPAKKVAGNSSPTD